MMDEADPLWIAVLKIAEGDRARANRMIANPDSLLQYPEVAALLGGGGGAEEWEGDGDAAMDEVTYAAEQLAVDDAPAAPAAASPTAAAPASAPAAPKAVKKQVELAPADPREHINLVFIGHVDAGKSTLSGNILYLTGNVDTRTIERYEREAKDLNRESWFLAFIMDTNEEERAKGKTVEVGRAYFATDHKRYTILDAPGHKNYVPNMIMGASQADVGVLVISARKGEFEAGFDRGGQTREHAMLAKTLGVDFLVVVINKMDDPTVNWGRERFDECLAELKPFLKSCGYKVKKEVKFLPISGLGGDNVLREVDPAVCPWWKKCYATNETNCTKPTLVSLLDSLKMAGRDPDQPLRIPVLDRYTERGTIAMGKVESGIVRPGLKITVMPTRLQYKVDAVWANEDPVDAARPGENVLVKLAGAGLEDVQKGYVICTAPACRAVAKLIVSLYVVDLPEHCPILTVGFAAIYHAHAIEEECVISKIFETTDKKGRTRKGEGAAFAKVGMRAVCMVETARSVCCETYTDKPFLGRFTLRSEGKTIAIGMVTKLPPKKEN